MPAALLTAAALTLTAANPLLGTWVNDRGAHLDRMNIASLDVMTITPEAIQFGTGKRALGLAPVAGFERGRRTLAVRTRFGDVYRFRFSGADRMCRVADDTAASQTIGLVPQCFSRDARPTILR